ncbi:hypothetical protein GMMP13_80009 [Candidatus Magnetomoraceae bacterium gMMP-13]
MIKEASTDLSYIFQKSENKGNKKELIYVPRHKGKITFKIGFEAKTRLEATVRLASSQFSGIENKDSEKIDAYASTDLKIIQPVSFQSLLPEFFVYVQNLFDRDFEFHKGYPDDGFRFTAGVNLNF